MIFLAGGLACSGAEGTGEPPPLPEPFEVTANPPSLTLKIGAAANVEVTASNGESVSKMTATSQNTAVATAAIVSGGLVVTAVGAGSTVVTVGDIYTASIPVTVLAPGTVQSITLTPGSASVTVGGVATLVPTVVVTSGADQSVSWFSSNGGIATVNSQGVVTGVAPGTATITATSLFDPTKAATAAVTVTSPLAFSNGIYVGAVNFGTNTGTVGALGLLPSCAGSSTQYLESGTLQVNAQGTGKFTLNDAAGFQREYGVILDANGAAASTGTFPFLGSSVPGVLAITVKGGTSNSVAPGAGGIVQKLSAARSVSAAGVAAPTIVFRETTQYGSCANTYAGTLTEQ